MLGADALDPREPGAVFHDQFRKGEPAPFQPIADRARRARRRRRRAIGLRVDGQEQLPGHHVVGELVDVADDLRQLRRGQRCEQARGRGGRPVLHLSGERAARLLPELPERPPDIARMVHQAHVPVLLAASQRVRARERRLGLVAAARERGARIALPVAAFRIGELERVAHRQARQRRFCAHRHAPVLGIRREYEAHGLEVHQQRIGSDVVGAQRLLVETARIVAVRGKVGAIQHQIARDVAQSFLAQFAQQQPEVLQRDLGVAVALQDQIARERAVLQFAVEVRLGLPGESRAQPLQRHERGHQFHHRCRIHRHVRAQRQRRLRGADLLDDDRDAVLRDAGLAQCVRHRRRRRGGGCRRGAQRRGQQ